MGSRSASTFEVRRAGLANEDPAALILETGYLSATTQDASPEADRLDLSGHVTTAGKTRVQLAGEVPLMKVPVEPANEIGRLDALRRYKVLDTLPEQALDDLTALAAHICGVPIALISLVDEHRQWFKSRIGLSVGETSRHVSFCAHALHHPDLFVVADTIEDARFADNPLVTDEPGIRFYAGAPLVTPTGHALGTICVIDREPRQLSKLQGDALRMLSRQVMAQLELRRQARELIASEHRLRTILDTEPECVKLVAADGSLLEMNLAGLRMLEADSFDQVANRCVYPMVVEEHRGAFQALNEAVFAGGSGLLEFQIVGLKGGRRWLETHATPLRDAAGQVTALLGVTRDITEQRRAATALRESEEHLRFTLESSRLGNWELDLTTDTASHSRRHDECFGYREPVAEWGFAKFIAHVHPEDRERVRRDFHAATSGLKPWDVECRVVWPDGSTHWIAARGSIFQRDGRPARMLGIVDDITERKQAEEQVRVQVDELLRWQKVTVGREQRVQQLKEEINRLLVAQGQPPRFTATARTTTPGGAARDTEGGRA